MAGILSQLIKEFIPEAAKRTQVTNTVNTYKKLIPYLEEQGIKDVLDYPSGLGAGTQAMRDAGLNVTAVEPFPQSKAVVQPDHTDIAEVLDKYPAIVNNQTLNVVPGDIRNSIVQNIADRLEVGGQGLIGVRSKGDVDQLGKNPKNKSLEDGGYLLPDGSYQRGFRQTELNEYLTDTLKNAEKDGKKFSVESFPMGAGPGAKVTRILGMLGTLGVGGMAADEDGEASMMPWIRRMVMDQAKTRGPSTGSLVDTVARGAWYNGGSWYPEIGKTFEGFLSGKQTPMKVGEPTGISLSALPDISKGFAKLEGGGYYLKQWPVENFNNLRYDFTDAVHKELSGVHDLETSTVNNLINGNYASYGDFDKIREGDLSPIDKIIDKLTAAPDLDIADFGRDIGIPGFRSLYEYRDPNRRIVKALPEFRSSPDKSVMPAWSSPDNQVANDLLNEAYVEAASRISQKNYRTQFAPIWNEDLTKQFSVEDLNNVYQQAKMTVGSEFPFSDEEKYILDKIVQYGEPNAVRVPANPLKYKDDSTQKNAFNKELSDVLLGKGIDALLYSPHRWGEYEMRVLDPGTVRVIESMDSIPFREGGDSRYKTAGKAAQNSKRLDRWRDGSPEGEHNLGDVYAQNEFWDNPMKYGGKYILPSLAALGIASNAEASTGETEPGFWDKVLLGAQTTGKGIDRASDYVGKAVMNAPEDITKELKTYPRRIYDQMTTDPAGGILNTISSVVPFAESVPESMRVMGNPNASWKEKLSSLGLVALDGLI